MNSELGTVNSELKFKVRSSKFAVPLFALGLLLVAALAWRAATDSVDFPIYHHAGAQVLAGDFELYPAEVYDGRPVGGHGFRYAPVWALLFVPFALLPLPVAAGIFYAVKVAAIVALAVFLGRHATANTSAGKLVGLMLLATGGYLLEELRGGNLQLLVIAGVVYATMRAASGAVAIPALIFGLAIAAKVTPAAFVVYVAVRHGVRHFVASAVVLSVVLAAPAMVWGSDQNTYLLTGFANYSRTSLETPENARNFSIRGWLSRVLPGSLRPSLEGIWAAVVCVFAVALFAALRRPWTLPRGQLEIALLLTLMPLLSPHSQRIYFTALSAAILLIGAAVPRATPTWALCRAALWICGIASTLLPLVLSSRSLSLRYMDAFPYTLSAAVLAVTLFVVLRGELSKIRPQCRACSRSS